MGMDPAEVRAHIVSLTQRVEALGQQLIELKTENQNLKLYINQTLENRPPPEPKVCPPEIFSGDRKRYREFLNACNLLFELRPRTYFCDRLKTRTLISYLSGEPRLWANVYLENEDPILNSYDAFCAAMSLLYEDPCKQLSAETALRSLKQGKRPVEDYISEFKRWSPDTQWNDISLRNQFRLGLSETLKDDLARVDLPQTLEGLIKLSISMDRRLRERKAERASGLSSYTPRSVPQESHVPMEIGTMRGPLTPTERNRRRNLNLCLYCAGASHTVSDCPLIRKKKEGEYTTVCKLLPTNKTTINYFFVTLLLQWDQKRLPVKALIDTGASGNFIDKKLVTVNKIPFCLKSNPVSVRLIDGSLLSSGPITHETQPLRVVCNHNHSEYLIFDLISSPHFPLILGLPWLALHQPTLNWETRQPEFLSPYCAETCILAHSLFQAVAVPSTTTSPTVPSAYQDFSDVFNKQLAETLPPHRPYDCPIDLLPDKNIPVGRIYPLSQPELQHLKEYLEDNLKRGFIRPSSSPAGAGMFFVRNKDKSLRPIIDYRELNNITIKNRYPLPLIPELLERLQTATVFTKLDLKGAYNLIRIKDGDEWKTAFRTRYGLFEYLVMPFGLCNAPATFQHFINDVFRDLLDVCVVVYLDDILIYSNNITDHRKHVRWVLSRLRVHKLYAKLEKCIFEVSSISFLGYIISDNQVQMDPSKIDCILNWPRPQSKKEVQRFLGFANFYRKFIQGFSSLVKPLTTLTSSKVRFSWTTQAQQAFDNLKARFTTAPILRLPDPNLQYVLEVDASNVALGAILSQRESQSKPLQPVAFFSRTLSPAEVNYPVGEKELLAVKTALETWRHLLEGTNLPIIIYTDHQNLQYIQRSKTLSARQLRWALFFDRFHFVITYRPGSKNGKADALSRKDSIIDYTRTHSPIIPQEKIINVMFNLKEELKEAQRLATPPDNIKKDAEGFLYKNNKLFIPSSLQLKILKLTHDAPLAGHPGITKTSELIKRHFWWPRMGTTIKDYINSCETCARSKHSNHPPFGLLTNLPIPGRPWENVSMDFIVDLPPAGGFTTILVVVDCLTKMAHFLPLQRLPNSQHTADIFIQQIIRLHGIPTKIISDRGSQFISKFWKALCEKLRIDHRLSTAFHPQSNGQTERINRCLEQYLRCYSSHLQDDWNQFLPIAEFAYNNSISATTQQTPFFANYGFHPHSFPADSLPCNNPSTEDYFQRLMETHEILKDSIEKAQERQKRYYDLRRRLNPQYQVGDKVWLSTKNLKLTTPSRKLSSLFVGPFPIRAIISPSAVRLELPQDYRIHPTFHVSLLKPYISGSFPGRNPPPPPPTVVEGVEEYEVAEILDSRLHRNRLQYFIKWKGFGPQDNTWEDVQDVHAPRLVKQFHRRFPEKPSEPVTHGVGLLTGGDCNILTDPTSGTDDDVIVVPAASHDSAPLLT